MVSECTGVIPIEVDQSEIRKAFIRKNMKKFPKMVTPQPSRGFMKADLLFFVTALYKI